MGNPKEISILVVDDEAALREAIVFDFKRRGFRVFEAGSGREAFELIKKQKIDLVLSDVRMPNGDGVELLDNIKMLSPELPVVIFITGYTDLTFEDVYDRGVDAIFEKPFDRNALMAAIDRALTTREERWSVEKRQKANTDFEIELELPSFGSSVRGRAINLGRGGMVVALQERLPRVDDKAYFRIRFKQGDPSLIEGNGTVRWVRNIASPDHPIGCGIEFQFLNDESRQRVIALIQQLHTKSFIPKN